MKTKDRKREAALVPMLSAGKHGRLQEVVVKGSSAGTNGQRWEAWKTAGSCGEGKRCIVPMVSARKHGRLQRAVV